MFYLRQLYQLWMMYVYTALLNKLKLKVDNTLLQCRQRNCFIDVRVGDKGFVCVFFYFTLYPF